jgi:hypothetical protein
MTTRIGGKTVDKVERFIEGLKDYFASSTPERYPGEGRTAR